MIVAVDTASASRWGKNAYPQIKPVEVKNACHANPTPSKRRYRFVLMAEATLSARFGLTTEFWVQRDIKAV
jgi:hypothetical protein